MGHINLHTSNKTGIDFIRYLSELDSKYRLNNKGDVIGMDHYGFNARKARNEYSRPGSDYISSNNTDTHDWSDLWNMDLNDTIDPTQNFGNGSHLPHLLQPPSDGIIELDGVTIDLSKLSPSEREEKIKDWQHENLWKFTDEIPPTGFIFGLQEPNFNVTTKKLGSALKNSDVKYDRTASRPRAGIIASKNMNIELEPAYTDGDVCTCTWDSGTEFGTIYLVSLYGENNQKPRNENVVIPPTLIRLLKKCRREGKHYIIMADTNSYSDVWNMPMTARNASNPNWHRGEVWEEALLDYNIKSLNVGNEWTYYRLDSTRDVDDPITSIIDVTFCSAGLDTLVSNWLVRDAVPISDHASIEFCFHLHSTNFFETSKEVYNFRKCNWSKFKHSIENVVPHDTQVGSIWTYDTLTQAVSDLYEDIARSLEDSCPTTVLNKQKQVDHTTKWYNDDCKKLYKRISKIRSYTRRLQTYPLKRGQSPKFSNEDVKAARKDYYKALDSAQNAAWQKHLGDITTMADLGKLNKALKSKPNAEITPFKKSDGTTMTPKETLDTLCKEHFPDCKDESRQEPISRLRKDTVASASCDLNDVRADLISMEKLKVAIASFANIKAPGTDGLPPVVFKNIGPKTLQRLLDIYKACYLLGFLPEKWHDVKVIFIPKPGKTNYALPRSFRPISLMQFMMKIMEKMLLWVNEEVTGLPLHKNQHGFRKGRSCDSNLTSLTTKIEKSLIDRKFRVQVWIDIKGAFDNIRNVSMEAAMRKKGCRPEYINWYLDFFNNRNIMVEYKGQSAKFWPSRGAPQGGVGSPWLWNIIADELYEALDRVPGLDISHDSDAYADDTGLGVTDVDPAVAVAKMTNDVLPVVLTWASEFFLELCPDKTVAMLFTRREERRVCKNGKIRGSYDKPPKVQFLGKELEFEETHKHLGVIFHKKGSWTPHITEKIRKATGVLIKLKNWMGKIWGLNPKSALWMYKAVARPMFTHGCLVWHKACEAQGIKEKLRNFQSKGLKNLGCFRRSTPRRGLEIVTYTFPLHLRRI